MRKRIFGISAHSTNLQQLYTYFSQTAQLHGCAQTHIIQNHNNFTYKARPEKHLPFVQPHKSWMVCT